ncbi:ATP-dependent RecD-like DNA helicase [Acholeplasma vituli]|uniref:ATP-dependent RecD2 DNA helicase n=1 Tax=Paracholeplasma vituli TaxID=69473 RepID=A0ABT2PWH3_9MOLU|nr:ATP-dependent RecD-like DNA helicase [Paracholeplasma vituli]MCU0105267.1 ATP-dependent RecD-like DNA helicase [Paracholeplasma vituli]
MRILTGNVTHYLFRNQDNGYSIAKVILEDESEVIMTGYFPELSKEVTYTFNCEETTHPKYGIQYKVIAFDKADVQNKEGLIAYLSSDLFTGIGPVKARKMVDLFGDQAIKKILDDKLILMEVGLNRLQIERFYQQLYDNQVIESTLVKLYGYGLSSKMAMRLFNKYKDETLSVLQNNPYRLIEDIEGVGFQKADAIAELFSIKKDDPRRVEAAILYGIKTYSFSKGDTFLFNKQLDTIYEVMLPEISDQKKSEGLNRLIESNHLLQEDNKYFLKTIYDTELAVSNHIKRLMVPIEDRTNEILNLIERAQFDLGIEYTEKQKDAILSALSSSISVVTGGPGTGKTTVISGILYVYSKLNKIDLGLESASEEILLVAPTGRASRRMQAVMNVKAMTIHRALGYNYDGIFLYNENYQLPHDLVVIDEASMIDIFLAENLFKSIPAHTQVIIVGDEDQLPSVGPGYVLGDIIASNQVPVIRLKEIHRQAKNSNIIGLAQVVNEQRVEDTDFESREDIKFMYLEPNKIIDTIKETIKQALSMGYDLYEDIQVLIPMYKGPLGIDAVNKALQETLMTFSKTITYGEKVFTIGDKVIQLTNSPEKGIMNGDIGIIKDISKSKDNEDIIYISFDDHVIPFQKGDLEDLNHAYAISIHKSQGSEYKVVIMPLVRAYMRLLRKELLYTGITRTKTHLSLLGDLRLIEQASKVLNEKRQTRLAHYLNESIESVEVDVSPYDFLE